MMRRRRERIQRHRTLGPRAFALLLGCLFLWGAAVPVPASAGRRPKPKQTFKIATLAPEGSTWMNIMRELDDAVRAETENRVGFKFYPGGVQGEELVVLKKIRLGQLNGGGFSGQGLGEIAPALRVLEVPFLFENQAEVDHVHAKLDPTFERILEEQGYVLLGWAEVGFIYLFTDRPVKGPEDLKDVKMWLWEGDPLATAFFNAYRISPIPLSVTDVLTALQTGLINGVYSSPLACIALQWFTRVKYMTDARLTHGMAAVVVDRRSWEKIRPEDQQRVRSLAATHFRRLTERTRVENEESIRVMGERGIEMVASDPERLRAFQEIGREVWQEQVGKLYSQELLDQVLAAVEEARAGDGSEMGSSLGSDGDGGTGSAAEAELPAGGTR
jgi:TRAP-type C4-dicarboxylate transport system substrate-binding protein